MTNNQDTFTDYKGLYESSEKIRESETTLFKHKIELWKNAYTALLAAMNGDGEDWREAIASLLDIISDLEEDVAMTEKIMSKRDEINEKGMKDGMRLIADMTASSVIKGFASILTDGKEKADTPKADTIEAEASPEPRKDGKKGKKAAATA